MPFFFFACACRQITTLEYHVPAWPNFLWPLTLFCLSLSVSGVGINIGTVTESCSLFMETTYFFGNFHFKSIQAILWKQNFFPFERNLFARSGKISMMSLFSDTFFLSHLRLTTEKPSTSPCSKNKHVGYWITKFDWQAKKYCK